MSIVNAVCMGYILICNSSTTMVLKNYRIAIESSRRGWRDYIIIYTNL